MLLYRLDGASAEVSDAAKQACTPDAYAIMRRIHSGRGQGHGLHVGESTRELSEPCRVAMADGGKPEPRSTSGARNASRGTTAEWPAIATLSAIFAVDRRRAGLFRL